MGKGQQLSSDLGQGQMVNCKVTATTSSGLNMVSDFQSTNYTSQASITFITQ